MNGVNFDEAYSKAFDLQKRIPEIRFTYQPEVLNVTVVGPFLYA